MVANRIEGEVLDERYRLLERLGRGGYGDVWRAEELLPDGSPLREVALKLLRGSAVGVDWSAEARIIASLRHHALVTIYAAGLLDVEGQQVPFVAMELLLGQSLAAFVHREEAVPWRRALAWAREAAAALDVIHRAGVVHLDLKPANLFLPTGGGVKVLDFGIARHGQHVPDAVAEPVATDDMSTAAFMAEQLGDAPAPGPAPASRLVVGTPGFMAPEIFADGEAVAASDAYALAACIVQLVTTELPQRIEPRPDGGDASTVDTTMRAWLSRVQAATVRGDLRDLRGDSRIPEALTKLVERWLALDPEARGVEPGTLRAQLDEVWRMPHGLGMPYRGLEPYGLAEEGRLWGRSGDAHRVGRELADSPCAVLLGEVGTGLESLALAGVTVELARAFVDDRDDWVAREISLQRGDIDAQLEREVGAFLDAQGAPPASDVVERLLAWRGPIGLVVVLDDLHRLDDEADASALRRLVDTAREGIRPGLRIVGTLRASDTAGFLEGAVGEQLRPWVRYVNPLGAGAVEELVRGPLSVSEREHGDVDAIVAELQAELGSDGARLPLVSLALERWWSSGELDEAAWVRQGRLLGPLVKHGDRVLAELDDSAAAERLLLRLVRADGTARSVAYADLLERAEEPEEVDRLLDVLIAARLAYRAGTHVRLSHPRLLDRWPRMNERRLAAVEEMTFLEELRAAVQRWILAGRGRRHVWSGDALDKLVRWYPEVRGELDDDEEAFVAACWGARRVRRAGWMMVALALVGTVVFAVWFDKRLADEAARAAAELDQARLETARGAMLSRARRADDPYVAAALLVGALEAGQDDPTLALDLAEAARGLPPATFLSLDPIRRPAFPWDERFLIGTSGAHVVIFDLEPPAGPEFAPFEIRFRPHEEGLVDLVPFAFGHGFVTRAIDGQLKVWRVGDHGEVALAATSPMRCERGLSPVLVAARAPVIACTTADGLARWDLRSPAKVERDAFLGRVLDVSPDGRELAAVGIDRLLLWREDRRQEIEMAVPPTVARFSPRDPLLALVRPRGLEVLDLSSSPPTGIFAKRTAIGEPVDARWHEGGLELAVCRVGGDGEWLYLREGGRPEGEVRPAPSARPCEVPAGPKRLYRASDYGAIASSEVGPRRFDGGWQLRDGRLITRDLVMYDLAADRSGRVQVLEGRPVEAGESTQAVFPEGDGRVAWQLGEHVVVVGPDGGVELEVPGRLLRRCPDGRLLAYRKAQDGALWELFGARHHALMRTVKRVPGFVLGTDPSCTRVWVQDHEGTVGEVAVKGPPGAAVSPEPVVPAGGATVLDGYVYDARPSAARGGLPAGLWLATSAGGIVRVGADRSLRAYGHASPRATAMADGPAPGDLLFADDRGVILRSGTGAPDRLLLAQQGALAWRDLRVIDDSHVLLATTDEVTILDIHQREIVGAMKTPHPRGRIAPWDGAGSMVLWSYTHMGGPRGELLPFGRELAIAMRDQLSNLRARLDDDRRIVLRWE